ncbi:hypothetical protein IC617_03845 [Neiella sp. HB171785]|uniref:Sulfurtransferase complex subunit TusB n=1 Tax=Neiella litorisoli TaxID=2771431 RepID=A0A8J6QT83_9GAMM|nr:DsrH/TusB family sulfur metabolism protein [Neiella litorisoli]MBD1388552.1 hypothetical protein [Neiella litorisoli]
MSSVSDRPIALLYVIRDEISGNWLDLVTEDDVIVLVENGVYRQQSQLPPISRIYALTSDCSARSVEPRAQIIDHGQWVDLSLRCQHIIRI